MVDPLFPDEREQIMAATGYSSEEIDTLLQTYPVGVLLALALPAGYAMLDNLGLVIRVPRDLANGGSLGTLA